jgi:8-oxo-dGTP diphosphatase
VVSGSTRRSGRTTPSRPAGYDISRFPVFAVTVDMVVLTVVDGSLQVLLVRRAGEPYAGFLALPGGFKRPHESLDEAAARELREEAGVGGDVRLRQFGAYGDPGRDPRTNVVTVAYLAVVDRIGTLRAGSDALEAGLYPVDAVTSGVYDLAFDHARIVADAVAEVGEQLELRDLALAFAGEEFTLTRLRQVYEAVWGERLDMANFRRSLLGPLPYVEGTGRTAPPGPDGGRPPELFRPTAAWRAGPPLRRSRRP